MKLSNDIDLVGEKERGVQVAFWSLAYTIACRYNSQKGREMEED